MAGVESTDKYPLTLELQKSRTAITFYSDSDIASWVNEETNAWGTVTSQLPHPASTHVSGNINTIKGLSASNITERIQAISEGYLSIQLIREMANRCGITDTPTIGFTAAEILARNSTSNQAPQQDAKTLSIVFRLIGDPAGWDKIGEKVVDMEKVKAAHLHEREQMEGLRSQASANWENEIAALRASIALKAPKEYWSGRAENHKNEAASARKLWNRSLIALMAMVSAFPLLMFSRVGTYILGTAPQDTAGLIERGAIIATVLAVIVWWSRQVLRDARSHEHLAEDAAERVTMIETYAALVERGLQSSDFSIILTALYRTAATGLVDDGGPALPIEVLMKTVGEFVSKK